MKANVHPGPKLSVKMVLLFSSVMLLAMLALSSFAIESSISGANEYTSGRFHNMSASITRDIEQSIELMNLTIDDLTQNLSFMANLNQFVRDDSADGKVGIAARNAGLTVTQGLLSSLLCNASAGEYALFTLIGSGAACVEIALATLIINARYLLMSCALSQRMSPDMPFYHRFFIGFDVTDELFGITIARPGCVEPRYFYGAMTASIPMWAAGTALGIFMGNLLPARIVSALSVALYGMFLAIIVPPAKENRVVLGCVLSAFAASAAFAFLPVLRDLSSGNRTIILTVVISALAAALFPRPAEEEAAA